MILTTLTRTRADASVGAREVASNATAATASKVFRQDIGLSMEGLSKQLAGGISVPPLSTLCGATAAAHLRNGNQRRHSNANHALPNAISSALRYQHGRPMPQNPHDSEHLRELAVEAFELSNCLCGPCRDLHALWPYIRLSRMSTGIEDQASKLQAQLNDFFARGLRDILIAGSADSGLLALVARARANHGTSIAVLDICGTPLELCRRFARRCALSIETFQQDLLDLNFSHRFDIVLVHGTLQFIAADRRPEALSRIRRALRPEGRLVLLFNTSHPVAAEDAERTRAEYADSVLNELKSLGIPLPEAAAAMRERLYAHSRRRELREGAFAEPEDVERALRDAGFRVDVCTEIDVRLAGAGRGFVSQISKRRFLAIGRAE
jgi:SAM-dependent methyltransferase